MKPFFYTLLSVLTITIFSCKKSEYQPLTQFDDQNIQQYIQKNNLSMQKADSGIYYQIVKQPTGDVIDYSSRIIFTYTMRSLDGKYVSADTNLNRNAAYLGYLNPAGLRDGIKKLLGRRNGTIRLLVPSKQGYGLSGYGKIPGNASLDYWINVYNASTQLEYDTLTIRDYIKKNSLAGFQKTASGTYYQVQTPGTGDSTLTTASKITVTYTGKLIDGTLFDSAEAAAPLTEQLSALIGGWKDALPLSNLKKSGKIRLLIPSNLGYGTEPKASIPANSILDFELTLIGFSE